MLYSVVLGDQNDLPNEWGFEKDNYDNVYFTCKSIFQRLRIKKKNCAENIVVAKSAANFKSFYLPEMINIQLSNNNLQPSVANWYNSDEEERNNHKDPNLMYITLNTSNYKLISYDVGYNVEIIGTYRRKDMYQGCLIQFNDETLSEKIISIDVFDYKTNRIQILTIYVNAETVDVRKYNMDEANISSEQASSLYRKHQKSINRMNHFKIQMVDPFKLLTRAYITTQEFYDRLMERVSGVQGLLCIVVDDPNNEEEIKFKLTEALANTGIKMITTCGVLLSPQIVKDLKAQKINIQYIFEYDLKYECVTNVKSN